MPAPLLDLPRNPVPSDPIAGFISAPDGIRLRYARWRPLTGSGRGTVCLLHGRTETIEKYFEVIGELRGRGFGVASFDWRGQGGSDRLLRDRRRGHVGKFADYDRDLETFMQEVVLKDCPPPYFILAHSTGGLIALRAARSQGDRYERMVLSAPLLGLAHAALPPPLLQLAARLGTSAGLAELPLPGHEARAADRMPFFGNVVTSDRARYERHAEVLKKDTRLAVGAATFGWLEAMRRALAQAEAADFAPPIRLPVLIVGAGHDGVVLTGAAERLARRLSAASFLTIADARHEIMMERDPLRDQFWAAFDKFMSA